VQNTIGIDISKDRLDVYRLADRCHAQFPNNKAGHRALIRWLGRSPDLRVIFEPTGAYHRQLEAALAARSLAAVKVNPRQARRFAEATGQMAKTDRVDAAMLARMGAVLQLEARPPRSSALDDLRACPRSS
jgi:transposase